VFGVRINCTGSRGNGFGIRDYGLGFRVERLRVQDVGARVQGSRVGVHGLGFRV
jgi:hypothetical protein